MIWTILIIIATIIFFVRITKNSKSDYYQHTSNYSSNTILSSSTYRKMNEQEFNSVFNNIRFSDNEMIIFDMLNKIQNKAINSSRPVFEIQSSLRHVAEELGGHIFDATLNRFKDIAFAQNLRENDYLRERTVSVFADELFKKINNKELQEMDYNERKKFVRLTMISIGESIVQLMLSK